MDQLNLASKTVRHYLLFLLLLGVVLYVSFIGMRDLWYPDELDIAEVARAMFVSGDWITPRRMGEIWVDYPPMLYWVGNISSHLLGEMSAFSLRLPNALAAIATVLLTAFAASRWRDARTGLWTGFSLLTFLLFVYEGNSYRPDVFFTLSITAGMLVYAAGTGAEPRHGLRLLAFVCFGLAMLSKGPLGLLLPGLVLVLWHGEQRQWRRVLELAPLGLIAIAVYLPWFLATSQAMGWENMLYEFYAQNLERFLTSEYRGHAQPWYYFLRNFWLDFSPWSWLFPFAVAWLVRSRLWRDPRFRLALWWFGTFFVFLSIAATKRQLYLLPAFPAAALLLGPWLASVGRTDPAEDADAPGTRPVRVYSLVLAVVYAALGLLFIGVAVKTGSLTAELDLNEQELQVAQNIRWPLAALGTVLLVSAVAIGQRWRRRDTRGLLVGIGGAQVALYVVVLAFVMPAFEPSKTYAPQSEWISRQIGDTSHFGMVDPAGVARRGGFAYYTGTMVDLLEDATDVERFFDAYPGSVVLVIEGSTDSLFAANPREWQARIVGQVRVGRHLYIVVRGPRPGA